MTALPFEGERRFSPSKKYEETVVFVHHFGGHKWSTKRHQDLVLDAGFDCVTFNLYFNSFEGPQSAAQQLSKMFRHLVGLEKDFVLQWAEQLNLILDQIPGDKVIFSLSSPSSAVASCWGLHQRTDLRAWICDCGPFLDAWQCFRNYSRYEAHLENPPFLQAFTLLGYLLFGGLSYQKRMREWMSRLPPAFPLLSLRAGKDLLVPPSSIQKFFSPYKDLNLKVFCFEEAGHLTAIKSMPEKYRQVVVTFLQEIHKTKKPS